MTLCTYLRFLRPVRSLLVIAFYTWIAFLAEYSWFHFDKATSCFLALSTALPLLLGIAIAGASHEPMHRAFFLLLPDGPRHLRRVTLLVMAVFAFAVSCAVAYVETSVPPLASLGLAAGLMALPCINRNRRGGIEGWLVAFCGWAVFNLTAGGLLRPAMIAAPWAFLLGGCALTAASLAWGLSRRHLRQRAGILFISPQIMFFSYLFHSRLMARRMDEAALYCGRRAKKNSPTGRDWQVRSVGSSTRAWMQVFWHAFAGRRRRNNFFTIQLTLIAPVIVWGLFMVLLGNSHAVSDYWQSLATLASAEPIRRHSPAVGSSWVWGWIMQAGAAGFTFLMIPPPQLAYPISRERLARVVFRLSLVQLAAALTLPGAAIFLLSLLGQMGSGHFLPGLGVPSIVATDCALAVGLPLLACSDSLSNSVLRVFWAVLVVIAILVAVPACIFLMPYVLTFSGIAIAALVASASVGLLRLCLRRHYRTCDLIPTPGLFGAVNSRLL
jgi:hypothetical protein